jgi:O-antigen/teichoic acid export membrane protein
MNTNTPTGKKVAQNASFLTAAYIMQKLLAFVFFTLVARWIGAEDVGKYVFAISLTTIISIFIDLGLSPILIRETARFKDKISEYLNAIVSLKLLLAVLSYLAAFLAVHLLGKDPMTELMVYLAGLVMIFDAFTLSFWGVFRGQQNLRYESFSIIINQIVIIVVGLGGLFLGFPLYILVIALLAGSFFSFLFSLYLVVTKLHHKFEFTWNTSLLKSLFVLALPFALAGIFTRVYSYIDQILLSTLIGDIQLGWYSVAYKITFALQFIPSAFAASIYPAMSNYYEHAREKLVKLFEKSMYFLMIISVPLAFGVIAIADPLILSVYTEEFLHSITPLQILVSALPAIFMAFPVGAMLNACNKQHINTVNLGITMVINIILNIILIPQFAHIGAAIAATSSLYYLFFSNLYFIKDIIGYNSSYLIQSLVKTLVASGIMMIAVVYSQGTITFLGAILVGMLVYPVVLLLLRGADRSDWDFMRSLVQRKS